MDDARQMFGVIRIAAAVVGPWQRCSKSATRIPPVERYNRVSLEIGKFRDASNFEGAFSEPGYEPIENNLFQLQPSS